MTTTTPSTHTSDKRTVLLVFAALMLVMLLASLSQTVLSTALPTIVGSLAGADHIAWVMTAYLLGMTVTMPIYGRLGDRLGRKPLLLIAIVLFTVGSLLGAIAQDMSLLIAARAVQGLGGGGLMVLSQAAIADVVPARERGKYMGILGAVFGLSSVAGPLLGGWFTEGPGWRWTFWINVPLGVLAFVAVVLLLQKPAVERAKTRVDHLGMALLAIATSALILGATWGGHQYAWTSPQIIALGVVTVAAAFAFVAVERRAEEPVMPLGLFRDRNFNLTTVGVIILGVCMFGSLSYLPTYLQMSVGVDATKAGLMMIPMMGGMLVTSIVVGQAVSRTGRYRWYPIAGAVVTGLGLFLLSTIEIGDARWHIEGALLVLGIGIGLGMQVLTLIVQNSFSHRIVGTATAANNFFRQVGGTLGAAAVGSIFTTRLTDSLAKELPESGAGGGSSSLTPDAVADLPPALHDVVVGAYNDALMPIFLWLVPFAAVSAAVLWFVHEKPLHHTIEVAKTDESLGEQTLDAAGAVSGAER
ncbi:DHA2 family efflux MFS transporter permease subunit [Aeromicrobium sp. 636]|uniref:MFS transporter n=1 Tax=Aeromicrobium senzhongii TaxID=2663859 RepID=A0A8I0ETQ7_9ACTN|nr:MULTISPECIES: MDR family MFS transporter [Aeromicrobium]MBC9225379.1 MFS transporter [Aeromicrobium senzhongii]MCQ3997489.1 DHA2 family efflux MFS transporter permease subunit [Aeromicrobium sp. 636]